MSIKRWGRFLLNSIEMSRVKLSTRGPRFTPGSLKVLNHELKYIDNASFVFIYKEIFLEKIYKTSNMGKSPYILDCGANIGLATIYLKNQYPESEIVAFEPDREVFTALKDNILSYNFKDITLVDKGLWSHDGEIEFFSEGADGGRVRSNEDTENIVKIKTTKLSNYINKKVDLLKIDIEGGEFEVLKEIKDKLHLVDRIFIEYHSFVGEKQCLPELLQILKDAGFHLNINTPGLKSQSPFFKIFQSNNMDMQLNIYAQR